MRRTLGCALAVFALTVALVGPATADGGTSPSPSATPADDPTPPPADPTYVVKTITVGESRQGRTIVATYKGWSDATDSVLVLGQMHGDEPAGPRVVSRMIKDVDISPGHAAWFIRTMNPDGNAHHHRTNARGVDLNRNWPTSGWTEAGKGSRTWGGPKKASEPETKAMIAFLTEYHPAYIASIHQPLAAIGKTGKDKDWEKRLSKALGLKIKALGVGTPKGKVSPTLTGWYNHELGDSGTATTVELHSSVSSSYIKKRAAPGILTAALVVVPAP